MRNSECGMRIEQQDGIYRGYCGRLSPNSRGFTLIETIITLVVLSIAAVGVLSVFTAGMKGSADPLIINQAISLAQGEMDVIMSVKKQVNGFTALGIGAGGCTSTMLADFTCSRNVFYVDPGDLNTSVGGPTDYKHVTVTVTAPAVGDVVIDALVTNY